MNNKTKAREFFVFPEQHLCLEPGGQAALGMTGEQQFIPHIRVIEYAAYADLEAKLQIAVEALELIIKRDSRLPDFSDKYETVTAYNAIAKLKAKHGEL